MSDGVKVMLWVVSFTEVGTVAGAVHAMLPDVETVSPAMFDVERA